MASTQVHVISHTHWDREWYLTREDYRLRLIDLIDGVLDRMDRDDAFTCFHLDGQTIVLEDYLEVRPDQKERLRRRIGGGRLMQLKYAHKDTLFSTLNRIKEFII